LENTNFSTDEIEDSSLKRKNSFNGDKVSKKQNLQSIGRAWQFLVVK